MTTLEDALKASVRDLFERTQIRDLLPRYDPDPVVRWGYWYDKVAKMGEDEIAALLAHRRLDYPTRAALHDAGHFDRDGLARRLAWKWRADLSPSRTWGTDQLVPSFRKAGFVTDRPKLISPPTAPLRIYRGGQVNAPIGMSWTTDRRIAATYADTFAANFTTEPYGVLAATVEPDRVLAIFGYEDEVVIDPEGISAEHDPDPPDPDR